MQVVAGAMEKVVEAIPSNVALVEGKGVEVAVGVVEGVVMAAVEAVAGVVEEVVDEVLVGWSCMTGCVCVLCLEDGMYQVRLDYGHAGCVDVTVRVVLQKGFDALDRRLVQCLPFELWI